MSQQNPPSPAIARLPKRKRSGERFEAIIKAAQCALDKSGELPSIPTLAETLGYTRASIYHFFPTPEALRNELIRRSFEEIAQVVEKASTDAARGSWESSIETVIAAVSEFYARDRIARTLILENPPSAESFAVREDASLAIGRSLRRMVTDCGLVLTDEPDAAWILVGIVDSVLRFSLLRFGEITPAMRSEALRVAVLYLASHGRP